MEFQSLISGLFSAENIYTWWVERSVNIIMKTRILKFPRKWHTWQEKKWELKFLVDLMLRCHLTFLEGYWMWYLNNYQRNRCWNLTITMRKFVQDNPYCLYFYFIIIVLPSATSTRCKVTSCLGNLCDNYLQMPIISPLKYIY